MSQHLQGFSWPVPPTIAVTRMRCHPPTQTYVTRRRAEGKTDKEIRRCIKRYLARHLYRTVSHTILSTA